jgi:hypothetical protein
MNEPFLYQMASVCLDTPTIRAASLIPTNSLFVSMVNLAMPNLTVSNLLRKPFLAAGRCGTQAGPAHKGYGNDFPNGFLPPVLGSCRLARAVIKRYCLQIILVFWQGLG